MEWFSLMLTGGQGHWQRKLLSLIERPLMEKAKRSIVLSFPLESMK